MKEWERKATLHIEPPCMAEEKQKLRELEKREKRRDIIEIAILITGTLALIAFMTYYIIEKTVL